MASQLLRKDLSVVVMIPAQGWNLEDWFSHQPCKEPQPEFSMSFQRRVGGWEGVLGDRGTSRMGPRGS